MSSHSSSAVALAKLPKQARGERRVAALLDAAALVFAEKGVDAATMTEIAKRAGAPIGSLYQFFPAKPALAQALLERYAARMKESMTALREVAPGLAPPALAEGLLGVMRTHAQDRLLATNLLEGCAEIAGQKGSFRARTLALVEAVLSAARPPLAPGRAAAMALPVLLLLKLVPHAGPEEAALPELERMLELYLRAG
jgi:AcrR family transcriptional regulator